MSFSTSGSYSRRLGKYALGVLAILGTVAVAQQPQSEFDKMLEGKPFDSEKLLRELPQDEQQNARINSPSNGEAPVLVGNPTISMVLPLDAPGLIGDAAAAFLEGFASAAETDGLYLSLETYRTDGQPGSGLEAYRQAVANGAGIVVGPLIRSAVEQVASLPAQSTVPTLLLQLPARDTHAGQIGAPPLYVFPLGGEAEIIQFGQLIRDADYTAIHVVVENSPLGSRLARAFDFHRPRYRRVIPNSHRIVNAESWNNIHVELRELIGETAEGVAVFAAGTAEFVSQARANIPGAIPIYTLATTQEGLGGGGRNLLNLDGLRFFEMPYLLKLRDGQSQLVAGEYAAQLPQILQRYVAGGMDAYRLATSFVSWSQQSQWSINGATGVLSLNGSSFIRKGILIELREGQLAEVTTPEDKSTP